MKRGFTLIETVFTIGITVLLFAALSSLFVGFTRLYARQQAAWSAQNAVNATMRALESATLPASHVLVTHSFSQATYASDAHTLVLELPSVGSDGSIKSGHYDYAVFYLSNGTAYRLVAADAVSARASGVAPLGSSLTDLSFSYDNADLTQSTRVTASVTAAITENGATAGRSFTEAMRLRNL